MTTIEQLRLLLGDREKLMVNDGFGVGDGTRTSFQLSMRPIKATSEAITLDGASQTRDTHYTINNDTCLITMASAPSDETLLVGQSYIYFTFTNAELQDILDRYGSNLNLSAAEGYRILAGQSARWFNYASGNERVWKDMNSKNFLAVAKTFEDKAMAEQSGQMDIGIQRSEIYLEEEDDD